MTTTATVGMKVTANGYPGTITKVCDGQLNGMVEVRLASGYVCLSFAAPDCIQQVEPKRG